MNTATTQKVPAHLMILSINAQKTGAHLKHLVGSHGYTIQEIMSITGVSSQQAIYKWYSGKSLPSIENLLILSRTLQTPINELLVTDEGPFFMPWDWSGPVIVSR